ncbi:hypothetical protein DFH09DRAFT_1325710 [Mycena vulgaris]|nr:hypothetical protein DFH09DRAFT_1325710 [Mycena vulgaris]
MLCTPYSTVLGKPTIPAPVLGGAWQNPELSSHRCPGQWTLKKTPLEIPELIDYTLSFLDAAEDFRAYSLVSRSWVHGAQLPRHPPILKMDDPTSEAGQIIFQTCFHLAGICGHLLPVSSYSSDDSSKAFLFWDHILTLDTEIHFLWKRCRFASAYSFFTIRYFAFASNIPGVAFLFFTIPTNSYTLELVDVTSIDKSGPGMCQQFIEIIERIETKYGCIIIYFITGADGGRKKGRVLLGKKRRYLILPSCWAHQFQLILTIALIGWINNHGKVRKIFDLVQRQVSLDRLGFILVLAYLVANLTHWTTHCIAFMRLFRLEEPLRLAVMQSRGAIIAAQVGAAKGAEKISFTEEATKFCNLILDATFWSSLKTFIEEIEPICYGTNINQKDSTRADQVLISLAGMFLRMAEHPEPEVASGTTTRLEKRWKDCDQPLFLLALILNPFEQLSCFGPNAGLNHFNCLELLVSYLSGTGMFGSWIGNEATFEKRMDSLFLRLLSSFNNLFQGRDPVAVWVALTTPAIAELADFAITLLKIVVNQAGCEHIFSDLKVKQTQRRNRLKLDKLVKMTKIGADIRKDQQERGEIKLRLKYTNHKSTDALLTVPRYQGASLGLNGRWLEDCDGQWVGDARAAETAVDDSDDVDSDADDLPGSRRWKKSTLVVLFGESTKAYTPRMSQAEIDAEAALMTDLANAEAAADAKEDARVDDGAVEIDSDEEFIA